MLFESPLLEPKDYAAPSVFRPENLLREARRQRRLPAGVVPEVCVLDPDGDLVRHLRATGQARRSAVWACYHTELYEFEAAGQHFGIVGCAVGAALSVLLAEQLFASGCALLLSLTSSGRIGEVGADACFILIDRALRDEGTSHHYAPPAAFAHADPALLARVRPTLAAIGPRVIEGATWTTDAPYRETEAAIAAARAQGVLAVEMEAAALYAFAAATGRAVLCLAHVTNTMAVAEGDFEKGEADGAHDALAVLTAAASAVRGHLARCASPA